MISSQARTSLPRMGLTVMLTFLLSALLLMLSSSVARADLDSKGLEFWLLFHQNEGVAELTLFITGEQDTSGTVEVPGLGFSTPFTVTAGDVTSVVVPATAQITTNDTIEDKGIRVTAADEITVYGLNRRQFTTDAYLGLPVDILGLDHIVLSYTALTEGDLGSAFALVATEDDTQVTITPSVTTGARLAGVPYVVTLDTGQTYQLRNSDTDADLTGTTIISDKAIAVWGGHECAFVPPGVFACDHLTSQLPPTSAWGTSFVTMPLATRIGGDIFRFLASNDNTQILVNGVPVATLDHGEHHEMLIDGPASINASGPILVAQYSRGSNADGVTSDPFMMLIPPHEQFLASYTVTTPATGFTSNFINVVAPAAAVGAITLDGVPIPAGDYTAIGASGFHGVQVAVALGAHNLEGPAPFGAFMYGFDSFDSYGYPGGMSLAPVATVTNITLDPEESTNPVGTEHCVTATVTDQNDDPVVGVRVDFEVSGAHSTSGFANTGGDGTSEFCYTGTTDGTDTIEASIGAINATASKVWEDEPDQPVVTTVTLDPEESINPVGTEHCVTATVTDQNDDPVVGVIVHFEVSGAHSTSGFANTGGDGTSEFCYTGTTVGTDTIEASIGAINATASKVWEDDPVGDPAGCSPGFWKNHPELSTIGTDGPITDLFVIPAELGALSGDTLSEALDYRGGGAAIGMARNLLRAAVAAAINAAHPDVNYPMGLADIQAQVDAALASMDRGTMEALKDTLDAHNNLGCSIDAHGNPI